MPVKIFNQGLIRHEKNWGKPSLPTVKQSLVMLKTPRRAPRSLPSGSLDL
jgi:hypothetical protein